MRLLLLPLIRSSRIPTNLEVMSVMAVRCRTSVPRINYSLPHRILYPKWLVEIFHGTIDPQHWNNIVKTRTKLNVDNPGIHVNVVAVRNSIKESEPFDFDCTTIDMTFRPELLQDKCAYSTRSQSRSKRDQQTWLFDDLAIWVRARMIVFGFKPSWVEAAKV